MCIYILETCLENGFQILNKKVMSKDLSLVNEEFDRDLNFLVVLVSSLEYLQINLKKTLSLWVN